MCFSIVTKNKLKLPGGYTDFEMKHLK